MSILLYVFIEILITIKNLFILEFEKSQNSIDYSGIDELADETEQFARPPPLPPNFLKKIKAEQDDYDDGSDDQTPGIFSQLSSLLKFIQDKKNNC